MSLSCLKTSIGTLRRFGLICGLIASQHAADGRTIAVQSNADGGPGSLRAALAGASDGDTINIAVRKNIVLTSGELLVTKNVTIRGPGANGPSIDGNGGNRVFHIMPVTTVTIDALVIANGRATTQLNNFPVTIGGGIYSDHAKLTVSNCVLRGNVADWGGAIFSNGDGSTATLTVSNCVISNNSASQGGGIYNDGETSGNAILQITGSTFDGNSGGQAGGAIMNDGENGSATLSITNSVITNNGAGCDSGDFLKGGSGIFNDGSFSGSASATITRCTISDNGNNICGDAARYGGGIMNLGYSGRSSVTVTESSVMRNQANFGGGIFNYSVEGSAHLMISSSTIGPSNYADLAGGGIYNSPGSDVSSQINNSTLTGNNCNFGAAILNDSDAALTLNNDTVSYNMGVGVWNVGRIEVGNCIFKTSGFAENFQSFFGEVISHGYNLSSDAAGGDGSTMPGGLLNGPGDIRNTDPKLGLLQNNGGPTLTCALLDNSPAINAGDPGFTPSSFNPALNYDQRGPAYPRVNNGRVDIGAFEWTVGQKTPGSQFKVKVTDVGPELGESVSDVGFIINRFDTSQVLLPGLQSVFKSRNGGESWSHTGPVSDEGIGVQPSFIRQSPTDPQLILAGNPDGLYRSSDFGDSWTRLGQSGFDYAFLPAAPNVILALVGNTEGNTISRSEDGGITFVGETNTGLPAAEFDPDTSEPIRNPGFTSLATSLADPNAVYLVLNSDPTGYYLPAIYKSSDGGRTFAALPGGPPNPVAVFPHPTNPNVLFVQNDPPATQQGNVPEPRILRSTNGGASFDVVSTNLPTGGLFYRIIFDAHNPSTIFVAGDRGAYRSTDLGHSFQPLGLTADQLKGADGVTAFSVDPTNSNVIYVNTDRGNFKSTDSGRTFRPISNGWKNALVYNISFDQTPKANLYAALGGGNGVVRTRDRGKSYERIADPIDPTDFSDRVRSFAFSATQPNVIFAGTLDAGLFRSLDSGRSWAQCYIDIGVPGFRAQDSEIAVDPTNGSNVYFAATDAFAGGGQGFYRSTDGGATFHLTLDAGLTAMAIDPMHPNVLYAGDRFGATPTLLKSSDGGLTFTSLAASGYPQRIFVDPSNPNVVFQCFGDLLRSNNGGATFLPAAIGLPAILDVAMDPQNPNRLYAWTVGGLFMTTDQGASWILVEADKSVKAAGNVGTMVVDPKNSNLVYISNFSVFEISIQDH